MPIDGKKMLLSVGGVTIWALDAGAFFFQSGMAIDADGAPTAYHPAGRGLDNLKNAGHPGNWYGVVTDNGRRDGTPVVQGPSDPAPGFYISPTALQNHHVPHTNPNRYVDSSSVPYISLPGHHNAVLKAKLGDLAYVVNRENGRSSAAIYADVGPATKIGEGSICLAKALGIGADPRHGNSAKRIAYVVFPHSGNGTPLPRSAFDAKAKMLFDSWGGMSQLSACFA